MIVFEIIGEILGWIFVEIIFERIILGTYRLLKKSFEWIKVNIFGFQLKPTDPKKALEKNSSIKKLSLPII